MSVPKILIVEDDLDMQEMMVSFMQKNGFMVIAANNADELTEKLKSQRVDLILLDVMLGDENGISICREIRETNNIPIIIVSALSADQDRLSGFEVGADDYIVKPFNPQILLAKVKAILKRGTKIASLAYRRNTNIYHFNNWIYKISWFFFILIFTNIHYNNSLWYANLYRRETNSICVVHCLKHIIHQFLLFFTNTIDWFRNLSK